MDTTFARRGHKLQAGLAGIIGEAFREMVKDRTYAPFAEQGEGPPLAGALMPIATAG